LELRRLTEESKQPVALSARSGHLIHHAAWRADDDILDGLTEQRELARLECYADHAADRGHRRDLERCRRAHSLAEGNARIDEKPQTTWSDGPLTPQQRNRAESVRGPSTSGIIPEQPSGVDILEHVEGDADHGVGLWTDREAAYR
jgi:hypothetical protein